MSDFVALEKHMCPICGDVHTHNVDGILLDKRLKDIPEENTITDYGLCEEHDRLHKKGFVALIEVTNAEDQSTLTIEKADRTGNLIHMKREKLKLILGDGFSEKTPLIFIDTELADKLKELNDELK